MYENTKLINKGLRYILCIKYVEKVLIPRKNYKQICLYFYPLQNISVSYITNSAGMPAEYFKQCLRKRYAIWMCHILLLPKWKKLGN